MIKFNQKYIKNIQMNKWINFTANELKNSYKNPQILKSGEDAVVFCKDTFGEFKGQGKYIINGIYEF